MPYKITLLPGDGIGPEITDGAVAVLNAVSRKYGRDFDINPMPIGGSALDLTGVPLPEDTLEACKTSAAVLVGAVGGPKWNDLKPHNRPERALFALRSSLGLYAGLYPVVINEKFIQASALKPDTVKRGADIMLVREMLGGIYNGEHGYRDGALGQEAFDTDVYSISETERIAKIAFELASSRRKTVTSVDKANTLYASRLWRATVERVAKGYPDVTLKQMYVNDCAAKLIASPSSFDVILAPNMFGDILSGVLAGLPGSVGMMPSCAVGNTSLGLYGAAHGSAPDIAGKDLADPIGIILSTAMMLSLSLGLPAEAAAIDNAVKKTLAKGLRTFDIAGGKKHVSCSRMAEEIALAILNS